MTPTGDFNLSLSDPHPLALIGGLMLFSYLAGRLAHHYRIPRVTGYLVAGMLASPSALGLLQSEWIAKDLSLITDLALAVIAFLIGGSLRLRKLEKLGKQILWITLTQGLGAMFLVAGALILGLSQLGSGMTLGQALPYAMVIGALSAATAPATTLAIIHETRAKGDMTNTLLGVVALDDALAIILFAVAGAGALALMHPGSFSGWQTLGGVLWEIGGSILLGALVASLLIFILRRSAHHQAILALVLGGVLVAAGLASTWGLSPLLTDMTLGLIIVNRLRHHTDVFNGVERIEEPLFGLFFTLAGAHLDWGLLLSAGLLGLLIMAGRLLGKLGGTWLGGSISGASPIIKRYLGIALLPKAGVTIGLALAAQNIFGPGPVTELVINAVLASVIINELVAPLLLRYALFRAGEIGRPLRRGVS